MTTQPPPDLGPQRTWVRWDRIGSTWHAGDAFAMPLPHDDRTTRPTQSRGPGGVYIPRSSPRTAVAMEYFRAKWTIPAWFAQYTMGRLTRFRSYAIPNRDTRSPHDIYAILPPLVQFGRIAGRSAGTRLYVYDGPKPLLFEGNLHHMKAVPIARAKIGEEGQIALDSYYQLGRPDQRFVHSCHVDGCADTAAFVLPDEGQGRRACPAHRMPCCLPIAP